MFCPAQTQLIYAQPERSLQRKYEGRLRKTKSTIEKSLTGQAAGGRDIGLNLNATLFDKVIRK